MQKLVRFVLLPLMLGAVPLAAASPPAAPSSRGWRQVEREFASGVRVTRSPLTGLPTFVAAAADRPLTSSLAARSAAGFLDVYGPAFGLRDSSEAQVTDTPADDRVGMQHTRLTQLHRGLPVTGGGLILHSRANGVVAVSSRTLTVPDGLDLTATLGPDEARRIARVLVAKHTAVDDPTFSAPRLEVFNRGMLDGTERPTRPAWFIEATGSRLHELIWIDARNGAVLLHFNQTPEARVRAVYTAEGEAVLPGTLVRSEGESASGDPDVDAAYDFSGDAYTYFSSYGRDSYDGNGATLSSSVHYCEPDFPGSCGCPCLNAFWDGAQAIFGDGFSRADDVVVHEFAHGVIDTSARLFYYMQSGALTESYADIFGETVDQTNGRGTDTPGVRWFVGEDLPATGAFRHMMNPAIFGDPARVSDPHFACEDPGDDNGGVHANSGVPNHAFALMVDGGSYNRVAVSGIGLDKAARIHYRALTHYLLSAANFGDQEDGLRQSCSDLIGTDGIDAADCAQVAAALQAVEMSQPWPCGDSQVEDPDPCPPGYARTTLWLDDLENGQENWSQTTVLGPDRWSVEEVFATSGRRHLHGGDRDGISDSAMEMVADVHTPAGSRLRFQHAYGFENDPFVRYDGGVVEYSINGGVTWADAGKLIIGGTTYGGSLSDCCGNPLAGRSAFVGDSFGYRTTLLDLSTLSGTDLRFRFRLATDEAVGDFGWFIDDIEIYRCVVATGSVTPSATPTPTPTRTRTAAPSVTRTPSVTTTATPTQAVTATPTASGTSTRTITVTPSLTCSPTATATESPIATATATTTSSPTGSASATRVPSDTPSATRSSTASATVTNDPTVTPTASATEARTATPTQPPTVTPEPCTGDCDGNGSVSIDELVQGVGMALGTAPAGACAAMDFNGDRRVGIDELVRAVNNSLRGCAERVPQYASYCCPRPGRALDCASCIFPASSAV